MHLLFAPGRFIMLASLAVSPAWALFCTGFRNRRTPAPRQRSGRRLLCDALRAPLEAMRQRTKKETIKKSNFARRLADLLAQWNSRTLATSTFPPTTAFSASRGRKT